MELKAKELRQMSDEELNEKLKSLKESLLKERSAIAMGGAPASPGTMHSIKKQIARILTIMEEKIE
ncbi:MAG: 50S ribosomal protein L29P [Ferroplasma sp. Type II]|uniref:50S ribosomal protein L29 n=1 Tax=Ferroplasma sp. Type II TaxID=261388 RepID=UPI0003894C94|nr:50S ribosomal protein L29 [Ferroplasma sp. Type II]EQB71934.1 MAG: 50S ribosomal protein L29P [Ferroplasma sp. Type II]EQB74289.1 MAG: 50S ribosomal protein L29P [Ferroplasma sp. Type II]